MEIYLKLIEIFNAKLCCSSLHSFSHWVRGILVVLHVVLKLVNVTEHSSHYATIILLEVHIISNHIVWLTDSGMPRTRQRQRTVHVQRTVITTQ